MKLKELKKLIDWVSEKEFAEFEIEHKGFRLRIARSSQGAVQIMQPAGAPLVISSHVPASAAEGSTHSISRLISAETGPPEEITAMEPEPPQSELEPEAALQIVKSPIVGTLYRAASPNSEPFVRLGEHVEPDTVVCIIEAMKLMNEIQAELSGEIVKIFVENGQPVEYGQPLFGLKA